MIEYAAEIAAIDPAAARLAFDQMRTLVSRRLGQFFCDYVNDEPLDRRLQNMPIPEYIDRVGDGLNFVLRGIVPW